MSFEREGFTFIAIAALVAAGMYAAALNRRSWALWLIAFALTIVALWVAYFFRDPARELAAGAALDIVTYHMDGERVQHRLCMEYFRFGSRTSAVSPSSAAPRVRVGETILSESTAFAELSQ